MIHKFYLGMLLILSLGFGWEADAASFNNLRSEVAKMACQIPPEDRYAVIVMAPRVDRVDLQDCVGRPITETIMEVLYQFQFTLVENAPFFSEGHAQNAGVERSTLSNTTEKSGVRSIFTGTVTTAGEQILVIYRMKSIETNEIVGILSCSLSKNEFRNCFFEDRLLLPTWGVFTEIPEPARIR